MNQKTKYLSKKKIMLLFLISVIVAILAIFQYNLKLEKKIDNSINQTLSEVLLQQRFNLRAEFNSDLNYIANLAAVLSLIGDNKEEIIDFLNKSLVNSNFDNISVVDTLGRGITHDRQAINVADRDHFQKSLSGDLSVGNPATSKVRNLVVTPLGAPIYDEKGHIIGVISGAYTVKNLKTLLLPSYGGSGMTHVIDRKSVV